MSDYKELLDLAIDYDKKLRLQSLKPWNIYYLDENENIVREEIWDLALGFANTGKDEQ
jgi:hypothetical protein